MKNIFVTLLAVLIIPSLLFSQDKQMKKLFNNYEYISGFSLETGSSEMDINVEKSNDFIKLLNNVKEIYILKINNYEASSQSINKFKKEINRLIDKKNYNSLLDITSDDVFKVLIKRDKNDNPSDIIVITEDDDDSLYIWATQ